jgi:ABC-type dipeptide/oligopeptide/nickel transport system permease subunit
MFLCCVLTLPYTLGPAGPGSASRRYDAQDLSRTLLPPFWSPHRDDERARLAAADQAGARQRAWLGTDHLGRDVLVRCLAGGGISLSIGLAAAMISVIIGTLYGTIAGFRGGRVDAVMMRILDVLYGLPYILLVVLLALAVDGLMEGAEARAIAAGRSVPRWAALLVGHRQLVNGITLLVAIGGVSWLTMARVIRGQVLSLKARPFMEAARAIGVPVRTQFTRHLLPNLLGPIIVYATLTVPAAILSESLLSFLGIGVKEPLPSWGNLAADGLSQLNRVRVRWWLLLWPCLLIASTLLALNFLGEGLRERYDPRRRT